ncbi:flagella synthesis protein FlgN [Halomonas elongata]|uniref:FlgN protein n=1 Tax=Halomonas elongata TaxID=2746 RepID=A0A1B8NZE4_HALEL|nr:flagellar export chaperone FlgN [Halomonas elongata]MDL4861260.1 flagellar export chaperone FlgN [Halomonas elongata]OBX35375.1 FlgN protein [Halomonas elongata]
MSLARLLDDQTSRLDTLATLLEEERALLLTGQPDGRTLQRLADDKAHLHDLLESTEAKRAGIQQRLGYAPGPAGARQAAEDAECLPHWQATLDAARRVARLNTGNGHLLSVRMTHNQRTLDYIHRLADPDTYAADGRASLQSRRLDARA